MTLRSFTLAPLLIAAGCLWASTALADNLTGQASIIDGDTIEIHGTRIRLWGIDAPESNQLCRDDESLQYQCGATAANELDAFIARRPVDCSPVSLDRYGRTVAVCSIDGVDPAEWLVRNGLALDWPLSDVYLKQHGDWVIVQEHVSVPLDAKTMTPDLMSRP